MEAIGLLAGAFLVELPAGTALEARHRAGRQLISKSFKAEFSVREGAAARISASSEISGFDFPSATSVRGASENLCSLRETSASPLLRVELI